VIIIAAEKNFENKIKDFLKENNCWHVKFFANAFTKSGIPDILCCVNGYFVAIEVKAENGTPSELQKHNIRQINECCGIGIILYPNQYSLFCRMINDLMDGHDMHAWMIAREINEQSGI
jgi:hypothetical protein